MSVDICPGCNTEVWGQDPWVRDRNNKDLYWHPDCFERDKVKSHECTHADQFIEYLKGQIEALQESCEMLAQQAGVNAKAAEQCAELNERLAIKDRQIVAMGAETDRLIDERDKYKAEVERLNKDIEPV